MPKKIIVDPGRCQGSGECVAVCPTGALFLVDGQAALVEEKCDLDGLCIPACPNSAIRLSEDG